MLQPSTCSSQAPWHNFNRLPHHFSLCLPVQHAQETATICGLGALPVAEESEDPLRPEGTDSFTSIPMATLIQMSPQVTTPITLSSTQVSSQLPKLTLPKTSQVAGIPFIMQPQAPSKGGPADLSDELLQL